MQTIELQNQLIEEIRQIPPENLMDIYKFIQQFRPNLTTPPVKKYKTVDDVFGKLYKKHRKAISVEEINAAIKRRMQNKFK